MTTQTLGTRESTAAVPRTWVAATGAFFILAAALTLTVARWWELPTWARAVALVGYAGTAGAGASLLRHRAPGVSLVLAHLAALLAVPCGIAIAGTAGAGWPVAIVVGGATGIVTCAVARRHTDAPLLADAGCSNSCS